MAGAGTTDEKQAVLHGYGMTSLIKYLMDNAKNEGKFNTFLHDVYSDIFEEDHPVKALIKKLNKPVELWWPDYLKEYISGNIYNVPSSVFLNANEDDLLKIAIEDNTEFSVNLSREYKDLSAKLFRFDLKYQETKENNQLQLKPKCSLSTPADPTTLLFGLKNNKLEYLTGGIGTVSCNIKEMQDKGYNTLLAAVVNNYYHLLTFDTDSYIDLSVKLKPKDTLNYTIVKVSVLGTYKYYDNTTSKRTYFYNPGSGYARYGTFENGKFESQWIAPYDDGGTKGIITLNVDLTSSPPKIIDYYVNESKITSYDGEINIIEGKNVNIPGYKRPYGGYEFYITGTETCNKISTLQNEYRSMPNYSWELIERNCDYNSYIRIILGGE